MISSMSQIHTNPTFYKSKGKAKFVDLKKNEFKKLEDGDLIALLPDKFIFKVVCGKSPESELPIQDPGTDSGSVKDNGLVKFVDLTNNIAWSSLPVVSNVYL